MPKTQIKTPSPILVGLMGCGKSSIGRKLAKHLELPLIDLDDYIVEKAGKSIPQIFAEDGEEAFRDLETAALKEVLGKQAVLATGGGAIMREENRALLKNHPPVIWLKASPEFLAHRIDGDSNRPLIAAGETLSKLQALADVRYPLYKACADFTLPRGKMSKRKALKVILKFLRKYKDK
ncbi:MAG: shikimate kinase [Zetaproteobacteria bacterium CG2_30_46_52]|nr:MAG: shikimate kinase [Zetaproteobacteria bacterium CG2_30_46_52]